MHTKRYLSEKNGFSLLEALVSLMLLSVVLLAFLWLFSGSTMRIFTAGRTNSALFIAQQTIEQRLTTPTGGTASSIIITVPNSPSITVSGRTLTAAISGTNASLTTFVPN